RPEPERRLARGRRTLERRRPGTRRRLGRAPDRLPGSHRVSYDPMYDLIPAWELEPIGRATNGVCAVAIPVRLLGSGRDVVGVSGEGILKITWPHPEAATEHLALQTWNGHGAARLVRADPARFALLLERLHTRDLTRVDIDEA